MDPRSRRLELAQHTGRGARAQRQKGPVYLPCLVISCKRRCCPRMLIWPRPGLPRQQADIDGARRGVPQTLYEEQSADAHAIDGSCVREPP